MSGDKEDVWMDRSKLDISGNCSDNVNENQNSIVIGVTKVESYHEDVFFDCCKI